LSKRNLDIDIESFKRDGIFPEALVNYAALLGWSHTLGKDILDLNRLVENVRPRFITVFILLIVLTIVVRSKVYEGQHDRQFPEVELLATAICAEVCWPRWPEI
jgi:hypothetical protein